MSRLFTTAVAGVLGCLVGTYYERSRLQRTDSQLLRSATAYITPLPVQTSPTDKLQAHPSNVQPPPPSPPPPPQPIDPARMMQIMQHGFPSTDGLRQFRNFVLGYDRRQRNPAWVFEHLSPGQLGGDPASRPDRANIEFFEDMYVHPYFRSTTSDYRRSGYDRGHMAAAGNHKLSMGDLNETFVLSNVTPQVGVGFNRGIWSKLERYVRYRAKSSRNTWVCTGPLYLPQQAQDGRNYVTYEVIGTQNVAVPTHFFKALLVENQDGQFELETYVMQNKPMDDALPLQAFQAPVEAIERASGLVLFDRFPRHRLKAANGPNKFLTKFDLSPQPKFPNDRR